MGLRRLPPPPTMCSPIALISTTSECRRWRIIPSTSRMSGVARSRAAVNAFAGSCDGAGDGWLMGIRALRTPTYSASQQAAGGGLHEAADLAGRRHPARASIIGPVVPFRGFAHGTRRQQGDPD